MNPLLKLLLEGTSLNTAQMAQILKLSEAELNGQLDALKKDGVLLGFRPVLNLSHEDSGVVRAVIEVRITPERGGGFNRLAERISKFDEVESCYLMSGGYDLLVFVNGASLQKVAAFVSEKLSTIEGVLSTATHFMLRSYKEHGFLLGGKVEETERLEVGAVKICDAEQHDCRNSMPIDDYEFRPITFQGTTFPATLMGVSILEPVLGIKDREFIDWVWGLRICCGVQKSAPAEFCARLAHRTVGLLLENRKQVLDGIRDRLGQYGFDADITFSDWVMAFQQINNLSKSVGGDCVWSAPSHPKDMKASDWQRLDQALERARTKFLETGNLDIKEGD